MGASNVIAAYSLYAGTVPATSMQVLTYMAVVSKDGDQWPWFGQGHEALALFALGRPGPVTRADVKAVERAMAPLAAVGAVTVDRRSAVRRNGPSTARYRLNLNTAHATRKTGDVNAEDIDGDVVDNQPQDPPRPPETVPHVPRKTGSRPPKNGLTSPEKRGTEEPRGTKRSEKEEEDHPVRTSVTVARAHEADANHDPSINNTPKINQPSLRLVDTTEPPVGELRGNGFCIHCYADTGSAVLALDPVHGALCATHTRGRLRAVPAPTAEGDPHA